jgi:hypothetical protein
MMRKTTRLAVLACASLFALAVSAQAMAAYTPRLEIKQSTHRETATPSVTITLTQPDADDATAKFTIYSSVGYTASLGQTAGTRIGTVSATVIATALGDAKLNLTGPVVVDNPALYVANPCVPGTHAAVWRLDASLQGQTIRIPLYVDQAAGPERAFASAKIQVCLPSPYIPQSSGGAAFGAKLVKASFSAAGVFSNPTARGNYLWRTLGTPYRVGTGTPNPAGTVEAQAIVPVPYQLTFARAKSKLRRILLFGGKLNAVGTPLAGASIKLYAGAKRTALKAVGRAAKTNRAGSYRLSWRKPRRRSKFMFFQARRLALRAGCVTPQLITNCVGATVSPIDSRILRVRVR